ncbi:MAG: hypothetical protein K0S12_1278 [Bacteroidetes bacterium]|nr:hypothetical protein [Bacteroidota bacterium]
MKNPIIGLLLAVTAMSGQTTYHYQKLKSGEGKMKKGLKEGSWMHWNYMGYPSMEATYKEGKLNGKTTFYQSDYRDSEAGSLEDMVKNNELYELRIKRQKAFEEYKNDWKLLLEKKFYYISKVVHYTDGRADTVNVYRKGRFKEQVVYPGSDTTVYIVRNFSPAGYKDSINQIVEEQAYADNKKHGAYKKYNTKYVDQLMASGFYLNGKKDSVWTYESPYDNIKTVTRYKEGKWHGLYLKTKYTSVLDCMLSLEGLFCE